MTGYWALGRNPVTRASTITESGSCYLPARFPGVRP